MATGGSRSRLRGPRQGGSRAPTARRGAGAAPLAQPGAGRRGSCCLGPRRRRGGSPPLFLSHFGDPRRSWEDLLAELERWTANFPRHWEDLVAEELAALRVTVDDARARRE